VKNAIVLLLLVAVFLSGCIGQPPSTGVGNGLIIKSFSPDFNEVRSGEEITFTLELENIGEKDATDISAEIFGGVHNASGWTFVQPNKAFVKLTDYGISFLRGVNPTLNLKGENYVLTWNVKSPENLRVDNTYTADARIYYDYETSSLSTLRFYSYDYLKSLPSEQFEKLKKEAGVVSSVKTSAPIEVGVSVGARPLIVYGNADSFTLEITLSNAGRGNAFDHSYTVTGAFSAVTGEAILPSQELHTIDVTIDTGGLDMACPSFTATGNKLHDEAVTLIRGSTKTIFCTIRNVNKDSVGNKKDYTVSVDLSYGYYDEASTSIKVLKSETTTTTAPSGGVPGA